VNDSRNASLRNIS